MATAVPIIGNKLQLSYNQFVIRIATREGGN